MMVGIGGDENDYLCRSDFAVGSSTGKYQRERREGSEGDVLSLQKVNTPFRVPRMRVKTEFHIACSPASLFQDFQVRPGRRAHIEEHSIFLASRKTCPHYCGGVMDEPA